MIISNFREYLDCLRNLFVNDNMGSVEAYLQDMAQSGKKQREYKEKLQKEIAVITAKINFLRQEMKRETDRRKISEQIKRLKENKTLLLKRLKQKTQTTRFAMLSDETKATLCTLKILRKYLTKELMENEFSGMKKDDNGNLIFDAKVFEDSFLYQDARHIYDYVSAYIIQNPGRVVSESHFNKFFDKESGWRGIVNQANKFFDAQNKRKKTRAEIIAESKSDIEFIREYPDNRVLLVRLKTPEALDYEGTAAHNCVGGGTYDKLLSKKHSGIYSLRRLTKDGELKPVVTIEYNDGMVKQVRGICNSIVAYDYNLPARDVVLRLMEKNDIAELVNNDDVKNDVLNSLGIYRNGKGGYLDIHNASGDEDFTIPRMGIVAESLGDYDFSKLKIKDLAVYGELKQKDVKFLEQFKSVEKLTIEETADNLCLDLSQLDKLENLTLKTKNSNCRVTGLSTSLKEFECEGDIRFANDEIDLEQFDAMKKLALKGVYFDVLKNFSGSNLKLDLDHDADIQFIGENNIELLKLTSTKPIKVDLRVDGAKEIRDMWADGLIDFKINTSSVKRINLKNTNLSNDFVFIPNVYYCFENCSFPVEIAKRIISSEIVNPYNECNGIESKGVCDFSDLRKVDFRAFAALRSPMKFAEELDYLYANGTILCPNAIRGIKKIKSLELGAIGVDKWLDCLPCENVDSLNMHASQKDILSRFPNLKELSCGGCPISKIPHSVEKLDYRQFFDITIRSSSYMEIDSCGDDGNYVFDISELSNLRDVSLRVQDARCEQLIFPKDIEKIYLQGEFSRLKKLDLSKYKGLKKVDFNLICHGLEEVNLPESIENIQGGNKGIGIGVLGGDKEKNKIKWTISEKAKPEVIAYLQKEWGKDNVILVPPKNRKEQILLPVMVMQQKTSRR